MSSCISDRHTHTHLIDDEIADIGRIAIVAENLVAGHHEAPRHDDEQVAEVLRAMRAANKNKSNKNSENNKSGWTDEG